MQEPFPSSLLPAEWMDRWDNQCFTGTHVEVPRSEERKTVNILLLVSSFTVSEGARGSRDVRTLRYLILDRSDVHKTKVIVGRVPTEN